MVTEGSYMKASEVRHPLIEHIQKNELYVTNDISLGSNTSKSGILLFGTNAVGKTSFIRAIGIIIIMAQTGLYVPCSSFEYSPYKAIFSRILGNDNLFKGLSTFAVEMSELRIILKMADQNSLVLGDELCSGTEIESALSLFCTGLIELHSKKSTFLFATHFHEITEYSEIQNLENLDIKHMAVHYDASKQCLIYDRKLSDGQGSRTYGLEVCKSLHMEDDFLEKAYQFRKKYFPESSGNLEHSNSRYNTKKIRGSCEKCHKKLAEETHHLSPQKNADKNGFIGTFHKNHPANLLSLCENCHLEIHKEGSEYVMKKTTLGIIPMKI
jgi:DNA mismatch repair protein MutS